MKHDGQTTRTRALAALHESRHRGDSLRETLKHLSLSIDMGVPAARTVREYLIRNGDWREQQ